jgi:hypothetical protein
MHLSNVPACISVYAWRTSQGYRDAITVKNEKKIHSTQPPRSPRSLSHGATFCFRLNSPGSTLFLSRDLGLSICLGPVLASKTLEDRPRDTIQHMLAKLEDDYWIPNLSEIDHIYEHTTENFLSRRVGCVLFCISYIAR